MHELSLANAIVATALRHAEGRKVVAVSLRVGALRQVVPRTLGFYFEIAARESGCAGARLDQEAVPALLRCRGCASEWDPAPPPAYGYEALIPSFRCPACEAIEIEVLAGEELEVESIEVEEPCIAPG